MTLDHAFASYPGEDCCLFPKCGQPRSAHDAPAEPTPERPLAWWERGLERPAQPHSAPDPTVADLSKQIEAHLAAAPDPEDRLLRLAEELAPPHFYVEGDCWFSCGLATEPGEDEPGSGCCNDSERGRCTCNRQEKVDEIHAALEAVVAQEREALEWRDNHTRILFEEVRKRMEMDQWNAAVEVAAERARGLKE